MKKFFTLIAVMLSLAVSANAQSDLQIISSLKAPLDTVRYKTDGSIGKIIAFAFINHGPNALVSTDTIGWKSPLFGGTVSLMLPAAGIPANDTVYYVDTIYVTTPPTTNPYTWCDSIFAKHAGGSIIADPVPANNKECQNVRFLLVTSTAVATVAGELKEVSVYPNPASDKINFSFASANNGAATATLRDIMGKTVMQMELGKASSGKISNSMDVSSLQNGVYFLELSQNGTKAVSRVAIQK